MALEFWPFALLAFGLGLKHAFDVDHVVAVSGLLSRQRRVGGALGLGVAWAAGHMVTAGLVAAAIYVLADTFLPALMARMELLVPFMLVAVGLVGLAIEYRRLHAHRHAHVPSGQEHSHVHVHGRRRHHEHGAMAGIGVVHGLASNDELLVVLLVGLAASTVWQVLLGVLLFSAGVVAGMAVYASAVHAVSRRSGRPWVPAATNAFFSVASIAYAVYLWTGGRGLNLAEALGLA